MEPAIVHEPSRPVPARKMWRVHVVYPVPGETKQHVDVVSRRYADGGVHVNERLYGERRTLFIPLSNIVCIEEVEG